MNKIFLIDDDDDDDQLFIKGAIELINPCYAI